jgi:excisionase family DNA binding protein
MKKIAHLHSTMHTTKVSMTLNDAHLTPDEAAKILGKNRTTILRWIQSGKIQATEVERRGQKVWLIPADAVMGNNGNSGLNFDTLYQGWLTACENGLMINKPMSRQTIDETMAYGLSLLWRFSQKEPSLQNFSVETFQIAIQNFPHDVAAKNDHFSMKKSMHRACVSFSKFLIMKGLFAAEKLQALQALKPVERYEPFRTIATLDDIKLLLKTNAEWIASRSEYVQKVARIIIMLASFAGLRNGDIRNLKINDIDLNAGTIIIRDGKGNKGRILGIQPELEDAILRWLPHRPKQAGQWFIVSSEFNPLTKGVIGSHIRHLAQRSGLVLTAHGLRRAFATIMMERGFSISELKIMMGHKNIKTTEQYIMHDVYSVVEKMKRGSGKSR